MNILIYFIMIINKVLLISGRRSIIIMTKEQIQQNWICKLESFFPNIFRY